jgi:hypothetical protein
MLMLPDTDAPVHDVAELSPSYAFGVGEIISTGHLGPRASSPVGPVRAQT